MYFIHNLQAFQINTSRCEVIQGQCHPKRDALHFGSRLQKFRSNILLPPPGLKMNTVESSESCMCICEPQADTTQGTATSVPLILQHQVSPHRLQFLDRSSFLTMPHVIYISVHTYITRVSQIHYSS